MSNERERDARVEAAVVALGKKYPWMVGEALHQTRADIAVVLAAADAAAPQAVQAVGAVPESAKRALIGGYFDPERDREAALHLLDHFERIAYRYTTPPARAQPTNEPPLVPSACVTVQLGAAQAQQAPTDVEIDALMLKIQAFGFACYMRESESIQVSMQYELRAALSAFGSGVGK